MSIKVPLDELSDAVSQRGPSAYLVTIGDSGPRVVSVAVKVQADATMTVEVGRHTAANVAVRPAVTLFWPVDFDDSKHTLLVDGTAVASPLAREQLVITPTSAMLHRVREGRGTPSQTEPNGRTES